MTPELHETNSSIDDLSAAKAYGLIQEVEIHNPKAIIHNKSFHIFSIKIPQIKIVKRTLKRLVRGNYSYSINFIMAIFFKF
ncbi:hypothetical protein LSO9J_200018 [Candidatus Liberibacter solanacearum]